MVQAYRGQFLEHKFVSGFAKTVFACTFCLESSQICKHSQFFFEKLAPGSCSKNENISHLTGGEDWRFQDVFAFELEPAFPGPVDEQDGDDGNVHDGDADSEDDPDSGYGDGAG